MNQTAYKISQLNEQIKDVLTGGFPDTVWICGEIQGYDRNRDKSHIFFELVEKEEHSANIVARIGLVIFSGKKFQIQSILKKSENPFELKDNIEVKFECKVDFYAPHGAVRLVVESIDPFYTLGKLAQDRLKLIADLKAKGILEKNKQQDFPIVPLNIGLVTSYDSAAYHDFMNELTSSGFGFQIHLRNTLMQGKGAEADVTRALDELERIKSLDVVVITRGGGSIADLACFDSRMIAERISSCKWPVLTGIGHEINVSVADLAAHTFLKTPTATAQFLVSRVQEFTDYLNEQQDHLLELVDRQMSDHKDDLKNSAVSLQGLTVSFLRHHREQIVRWNQIIVTKPADVLRSQKEALMDVRKNVGQTALRQLQSEKQRAQSFQKMVDIASPVNTLKRGFSIARSKDGRVVKSLEQLKKGDMMATEFADGVVESEVRNMR